MILTLAKLKNWKKYIIDVETAFLYGDLAEKIYMTKPIGYDDIIRALIDEGISTEEEGLNIMDDAVLELIKTIYGLVQAA